MSAKEKASARYMTDEEIVRNYREAKNKREQVKILADLNCMSREEIIQILKDGGIKQQELPRNRGEKKAEAEKTAKKKKEKTVNRTVAERLEEEERAEREKREKREAGKAAVPRILDSGERTEFASGAVRDTARGKGRCDLLPLDVCACLMDCDPVLVQLQRFFYEKQRDALWVLLREVSEPAFGLFRGMADMLLEVAVHFEDGERNWEKGIPIARYVDSAVRHYLKWKRGDTDERHDRAFVWNILCMARQARRENWYGA